MAATSSQPRTFSSPSSSAFSPCFSNVKQVFLSDWWLIKPDGNDCRGLRIGGINSNQRLGIRVFRSAEIQKRHDSVTLETADSITINICGTINRSRTFQNGFSQQVCDHFGFGFPYDWDEFSDGSFPKDRADPKFTGSIENLPTCLIRDFSPSIELSYSMFEDILQKFGTKAKKGASQPSQTSQTPNFTVKEAPTKGKKKTAAQPNQETRRKEKPKRAVDERIELDSNALRKGPLTRSMAHLAQSEKKKMKETVLESPPHSVRATEVVHLAQSEKKKMNETVLENPPRSVRATEVVHLTQSEKKKMNEIVLQNPPRSVRATKVVHLAQSEKKMKETVLESPPRSVRAAKVVVKGSNTAGNKTISSSSAAREIRRLSLRNRTVEHCI